MKPNAQWNARGASIARWANFDQSGLHCRLRQTGFIRALDSPGLEWAPLLITPDSIVDKTR
eukprot:8457326-Lingulodinium_polyedra.AAC.1